MTFISVAIQFQLQLNNIAYASRRRINPIVFVKENALLRVRLKMQVNTAESQEQQNYMISNFLGHIHASVYTCASMDLFA